MLRNRFYYGVKPYIPSRMRMAVRRWFAIRKREQVRDRWPILPGSETLPAGWSGWPEGKQFALVLTHDVESQAGIENCRRLMELEMKLGFRSSFNFVPENSHQVPDDLICELKQNGFEVGVHDLHHDGKLYWNREQFSRDAARINRYLKHWGATGFRSAFMLRNLEWLHDLDIQYDASTFDTDPFEPQPDGAGTIFPFWVPNPRVDFALNRDPSRDLSLNPVTNGNSAANSRLASNGNDLQPLTSPLNGSNGDRPAFSSSKAHTSAFSLQPSAFAHRGYVELPYTLPQDSTLFLLFRERHPDIWCQKLDWIAKHGGMALTVTHPDYMCFGQDECGPGKYKAQHYEAFLNYVLERYRNSYWHTLPREVAAFSVPKQMPKISNSKHVLDTPMGIS